MREEQTKPKEESGQAPKFRIFKEGMLEQAPYINSSTRGPRKNKLDRVPTRQNLSHYNRSTRLTFIGRLNMSSCLEIKRYMKNSYENWSALYTTAIFSLK